MLVCPQNGTHKAILWTRCCQMNDHALHADALHIKNMLNLTMICSIYSACTVVQFNRFYVLCGVLLLEGSCPKTGLSPGPQFSHTMTPLQKIMPLKKQTRHSHNCVVSSTVHLQLAILSRCRCQVASEQSLPLTPVNEGVLGTIVLQCGPSIELGLDFSIVSFPLCTHA